MICKVCGNDIGDAKFCTVCGTQATSLEGGSEFETQAPDMMGETPVAQKPDFIKNIMGDKKKLLIGAVAIVVVLAIVLGLIFGIQSKEVKIFNALKKTVFDSKSLTVSIGDSYKAKIAFGDGVEGTAVEFEEYGEKYEIKNGKIEYANGEKENVSDIFKNFEAQLKELGIDINIEEELDKVLTGKINEKEFEKLYDSTIKPALEEALGEEFDAEIELPNYDKTMKLVKKFLNSLSKDAVTTKKDGKKYKVTVKMDDFMVELVEFCSKTKEIKNIVTAIDDDDLTEYLEMDKKELKDEMKDIFGSEKVKFEVKIEGGRITAFEADGTEIKIKDINKTEV